MPINHKNIQVRMTLLHNALEALVSASLAFLLNILVVLYALWDIVDHTILLTWSSILLLLLLLRLIHAKKTYQNMNETNITRKELEFKAFVLITVAIFSFGVFNFSPNELMYQAFLIMVSAGISAGAIMSLSYYRELIITYILILLLPFITVLLIYGTVLHNLMVILIIAYIIVLIRFALKYNSDLINLIVSQYTIEKAQKELQLSKDHFSTIFEQAPVGICTYDEKLIITNSNQALASILSAPLEKLIGLDLKALPDDSLLPALEVTLNGEKGFYEGKYTTQIMKLDLWISMQTAPMYNTENRIIGGLVLVTDITQRVKSDEKIRHQAFYDHLTGLANRLTLLDRLEQQMARLMRHKHFGAVIFIDLDHFKTINDSLGHDVGDELLKQFADRMLSITRKEDTIARLGGDEFVILLSDLDNSLDEATKLAYEIAQKHQVLMNTPFTIGEHTLHITMSQGVTIIGAKDLDIHTIIKNADIAMYEAKKAGRSNTKFFEDGMTTAIHQRLELHNDLRTAINLEQFELYYQPILNTTTDEIVACEALIRWNHPTKGLIPPNEFISFAEEHNLILPIGRWVVESVCRAYINWSEHTKSKIQHIAINISPKQFNQDEFNKHLAVTLKKYNLEPTLLKLELTESVVINNLESTIDRIKELQHLGYEIAMDDFGTGYSSLSYLKNLPFNIIKIDRAFIENILKNREDESLVKVILSISEQFNFEVIAEGVEEQGQVELLKELKCHYYQGYLISKPIPSKEFEKLLLK